MSAGIFRFIKWELTHHALPQVGRRNLSILDSLAIWGSFHSDSLILRIRKQVVGGRAAQNLLTIVLLLKPCSTCS